MKITSKSSRRRKSAQSSVDSDQRRFLETAFVPIVTEDGKGPVIDEPEYDFVLIHGGAIINLCKLPIRRNGQQQVKIPGEKELIINGFLIATRTQLASWQANGTFDIDNFWASKALVFNRPVLPSFTMLQFIREQQEQEAPIIMDMRPFA